MDKETLEKAVLLSNNIRSSEIKLSEIEEVIDGLRNFGDELKNSKHAVMIEFCSHDIHLDNNELESVLNLCKTRLKKELSESKENFKNF